MDYFLINIAKEEISENQSTLEFLVFSYDKGIFTSKKEKYLINL
jgi:hypothetical protein